MWVKTYTKTVKNTGKLVPLLDASLGEVQEDMKRCLEGFLFSCPPNMGINGLLGYSEYREIYRPKDMIWR